MELVNAVLTRERGADDRLDVPLVLTMTLGVLASLLVGLSVASSLRAGLTSVAVGFVIAVGVVVATVVVFELGHRLGAE